MIFCQVLMGVVIGFWLAIWLPLYLAFRRYEFEKKQEGYREEGNSPDFKATDVLVMARDEAMSRCYLLAQEPGLAPWERRKTKVYLSIQDAFDNKSLETLKQIIARVNELLDEQEKGKVS